MTSPDDNLVQSTNVSNSTSIDVKNNNQPNNYNRHVNSNNNNIHPPSLGTEIRLLMTSRDAGAVIGEKNQFPLKIFHNSSFNRKRWFIDSKASCWLSSNSNTSTRLSVTGTFISYSWRSKPKFRRSQKNNSSFNRQFSSLIVQSTKKHCWWKFSSYRKRSTIRCSIGNSTSCSSNLLWSYHRQRWSTCQRIKTKI